MRPITAGVSTVELGVCGSGTGWQGRVRVCCASETQAHAIGLEVQLVAMGWEQRHADRCLKGCLYGSLWLDQSCGGILTMAVVLEVRRGKWTTEAVSRGPGTMPLPRPWKNRHD